MNFANTSVLLSSNNTLSHKDDVALNENKAIYSFSQQVALNEFKTGKVDSSDCFFYHILELNESLHKAETEYYIEYYRDLTDSINGTAVMHEDAGDDEKGIIGFFKKIFRAIGNFFKTIWNWITGKSKDNDANKLPKIKELAEKLKEDESKNVTFKLYHYPNIKNFKNDPFLQAVEGISKRIEDILSGNDNGQNIGDEGEIYRNFIEKGLNEHRRPNAGGSGGVKEIGDFQKYINENITYVEDNKTMNLKEFKKFCLDFVTNNEGHADEYARLIKAFEDKSKELEKKVESYKNNADNNSNSKDRAKGLMTQFSNANKAYASMINAISGWETKAIDELLTILEKEVNGTEEKKDENTSSENKENKEGESSTAPEGEKKEPEAKVLDLTPINKINLDDPAEITKAANGVSIAKDSFSSFGVEIALGSDGKVSATGNLDPSSPYKKETLDKIVSDMQGYYNLLKDNPKAKKIIDSIKGVEEAPQQKPTEKKKATAKKKTANEKKEAKRQKEMQHNNRANAMDSHGNSWGESASIHGEPFNSDTLFDNEDYRDFNPSTWLDVQLKTEAYALNYEIREYQRRVALQEALILSDENPMKYQRLIAMREAEETRFQKNAANVFAAVKKALNIFIGKVKDSCNANVAFVKKYKAFIEKPVKIVGIKSKGDILAGANRIKKPTQLVAFDSKTLKDDLVDKETFFKNKVYNNYKETSSFAKRNVTLDDAGEMKKYLMLYFGGAGEEKLDFETATINANKNLILEFIQSVNSIVAKVNNTLDKIELEMKRAGAEVDKNKPADNKPVENKPAEAKPDEAKPAEGGEATPKEESAYFSILYENYIYNEADATDPDKGASGEGENAENSADIAKMAQVYLDTYSTILTTQIGCAEFIVKEFMDLMIKHVESYMTDEQKQNFDPPQKPGQNDDDDQPAAATTT